MKLYYKFKNAEGGGKEHSRKPEVREKKVKHKRNSFFINKTRVLIAFHLSIKE